jgi:hypothetical protein
VSAQWRLFLAALRYLIPGPHAAVVDIVPPAATRFVPLAAMVLGSLSGGLYWLAATLWPSSVALVVSLLGSALATGNYKQSSGPWVFALLIKYNALMALSAAALPIPLPEHVPLVLIMVAGYAASRALAASVPPAPATAAGRATITDLGVALVLGFAPAALLGVPGLTGLAAALAGRLALSAYVLPKLPTDQFPMRLDIAQQSTEICFYLGALATWSYI